MRFQPGNQDPGYVLALARQRAKRDRDLVRILEIALKHPDLKWAKHTTSGLTLAGPNGTAGCHFTASDVRAHKNLVGQLRRAGIYPLARKD